MALIELEDAARVFGDLVVFEGVSCRVEDGDRIGVVGENGSGKTTLLRLLAGQVGPDAGVRRERRGLRAAFGSQVPDLPGASTVLEAAEASLEELAALERRLGELEKAMGEAPARAEPRREYGRVQAAFEALGGYDRPRAVRRALAGVGLPEDCWAREVSTLSGGERSRLALACLLLAPTDCLFLDEPTNHLDVEAIAFLEVMLRERPGAVVAASHDRRFLDRLATSILEVEDARVERYRGNYSQSRRQKAQALLTQARQHRKQEDFVAREMEFIRRNMAGRRSREAKGRLKRLRRLERVERPHPRRSRVRLALGEGTGRRGRSLVELSGVSCALGGKEVLQEVSLRWREGEILGIVGANGAGKTTLLRILAGTLEPSGGAVRRTRGPRAGFLGQEMEPLDPELTVLSAAAQCAPGLAEGGLRDHLARFLFTSEEVDQPVGALSGGERRRLSLARLLLSGFDLLLLDEPTNHLDIPTREAVEEALEGYDGSVALVTHDRALLDRVADRILWLHQGRARVVEGGTQELEAAQAEARRVQSEAARAARPQPPRSRDHRPRRSGGIRNPMELERLEGRIVVAEEALEEVRHAMGGGEAWKDPEKMRALRAREQELTEELAALYERWETWQ